jgi:serine/threonine protein phosphatase PrpC
LTVVHYAGLSDVGRVRLKNEDAWYGDREQGVFLVSDGIGGHQAGEVAARVVADLLPGRLAEAVCGADSLDDPTVIQRARDAVAGLSCSMRDEAERRPSLSGMGATVAALLVKAGHGLILHLGDSRAYQLRGGHLQLLTTDHTLAQFLVESGVVAPEQASQHPGRCRLTQYVGMSGEAKPGAQILNLQSNDRLLLCTDGLSGAVDIDELREALSTAQDPESACRRLIDAANSAGGRDNVTVLIVQIA